MLSVILNELVKKIKPGINTLKLCTHGDNRIIEETNRIYKDIKYKGIAFPTNISINNIVGNCVHDSVINNGDIVKIDLGAHIDGYPAFVTYTVVVNTGKEKINDKRSNVVKAVIEASREIFSIMKPDNTNRDVVNILEKVSQKYGVNLPITNERGNIPGIYSYQISRYVIDGYNDDTDEHVHRLILHRNNPNYDFVLRETLFEDGEIYTIDIVMSTGSGRLSREESSNILKKSYRKYEPLRLSSSKASLASFKKDIFPQNVTSLLNPRFKLGLKECINKGIIEEYPTTLEKEGEYTARIKFTVIVKKDPVLIIGFPI